MGHAHNQYERVPFEWYRLFNYFRVQRQAAGHSLPPSISSHERPREHESRPDGAEAAEEVQRDVGRRVEIAAAAQERHRLHTERGERREAAEEADGQEELQRTGREARALREEEERAHDEVHEEAAERIDRERAERKHRPEPRADLRRHEIAADGTEAAAEEYQDKRWQGESFLSIISAAQNARWELRAFPRHFL